MLQDESHAERTPLPRFRDKIPHREDNANDATMQAQTETVDQSTGQLAQQQVNKIEAVPR